MQLKHGEIDDVPAHGRPIIAAVRICQKLLRIHAIKIESRDSKTGVHRPGEVYSRLPDDLELGRDDLTFGLHADDRRHLLEAAIRALEGPISPAPPDPDLLTAEPGRLVRAAARGAAMRRAATSISEAFAARERRAVPFGSVLDGPVHGRSDLDMVVPGEMGREERLALWRLADEIAAAEGVELDLHFEHLYQEGFLDELRTIRDGRVVTLRELTETGADQDPPGL